MDWFLFVIFFAAAMAAGTTGAVFEPGEWYKSLSKPWWTPPGWMFPLVWTVLYIAMAVAAARVAPLEGSAYAMAFWALQIAFNTLWTPIFFGLRRMRFAMGVMVGLWVAVAGTLVLMWPLDRIAALLFAPYLLWVSVAGLLNFTVMRMNPGEKGLRAMG
jgi:tryptophan-rich sensory protein